MSSHRTGDGDVASSSKEDDEQDRIQSRSGSVLDDDDGEEGAVSGSNLLLLQTHPVKVTTKNKVICTTAYVILILSMIGYIVQLVRYHLSYVEIADHPHFAGPIDSLYVISGCDTVASLVGVWTCVAKTGPKAMIYACSWLLVSSLLQVCITFSLQFSSKSFEKHKLEHCPASNANAEDCVMYNTLTIYLWCSLLAILLKLIVIFLCRFNYPQVFNWLLGKQVLVDEGIMGQVFSVSNIGTMGAGYFDPCDIERLAARGSMGGHVLGTTSSNTNTIVVTRSGTGSNENIHEEEAGEQPRRKSRRATLISISPN